MSIKVNRLVKIAMLSAVAFVVMLLEVPTPFSTFLKIDLSDVIALMGGFALGPFAGIVIVFVKNFIHLAISQTAGVGELSNFVIGGSFVFVAATVYQNKAFHHKLSKAQFSPLAWACLTMVVVAAFMNYFVLIPLYAKVLGFTIEMVVGATQVINPFVTDKWTFILFAIIPFNIVKSLLISVVSFVLYPKLAYIIKQETAKL